MRTLGIGIDLVDVEEFTEQLSAPGTVLVELFTPSELARAGSSGDAGTRARRLAARLAAKEAFVKAWSGARLGRAPSLPMIDLAQVEVATDQMGRPRIELAGAVRAAVHDALGEVSVLVSLTHEDRMAGAVVLIQDQEG